MPEIAIVAGEASGDASGAALVKELSARRSDIHFWGAGGLQMREAGVDIAADLSVGGAIGIVQSLGLVPELLVEYFKLKRMIVRRRPDLLILIDFGAVNVRLGRAARRNGIKTLYYFPPSSWRKQLDDVSRLRDCTDKVVTPFPWSETLLRKGGVDAHFPGHPLLDLVRPRLTRTEFCEYLGVNPDARIIGLLPGSRKHEIKYSLPVLLRASEIIKESLPSTEFVVAAGSGDTYSKMRSIVDADWPGVAVAKNMTYDVMSQSELLLTCSGTATLEAAITGTPMVIFYCGGGLMRLEYALRKARVLEGFIGMPNIIAERGICPELVAHAATHGAIAEAALGILLDESRAQQMKRDLVEVKSVLGTPGATARTASIVMDLMKI